MLAGQIVAANQIEMIEIPKPVPAEGEILVRLEAAALCGSDLPYYTLDRENPAVTGLPDPLPAGLSLHELVGRVVESRGSRYAPGDRVLALPVEPHLGFSEYFLSSDALAVPVPGGPAEHLVISQPLGTVVHACLKLPNLLGQTVLVLGAGPIGQLFTALLRRMGALRVITADLLPERAELARRMGATQSCSGDAEELGELVAGLTGGLGVDLAVEAVGQAESVNQAAALVRRGGRLLVFGVPHRDLCDFRLRNFFFNEGQMICSVGPDVQHDFRIAVEMVSSGAIDVTPLVTHQFPFEEAAEAFDLFAARRDGVIKAVLRCN